MSPSWKRALVILLLVVTLVVAGLMVAAWSMLPLAHTSITFDGDRFSLADLASTHAVVFFAIAVVAVVFAVMVAIAAGAFGLGLGLLGLAFGGLVTVGTLALVAAPFALVVWLLWRLTHPRASTTPIRT
ncbi:MAG: hypothetical protein ABIZ18_07785 [Caldimonas sp.]